GKLTNFLNLTGPGFVKKTGDNSYVMDNTAYQPLGIFLTNISSVPIGTGSARGFLKKTSDNSVTLDNTDYQPLATVLTAISSNTMGPSSPRGYLRKGSDNTVTVDNVAPGSNTQVLFN